MAEEKKKSGLQKDISSIFAGLEDIDNGRAEKPRVPPEKVPAPSVPGASHSGPVPPLPASKLNDSPTSSSPSITVSESLISSGSFPKRRNTFIGLDIGSSSIKLIQLYPVSEGWEIGGYAIQEFQTGGTGKGFGESEHFARRLKELFASAGIPRSGVICSLRGDQVSTSLIQLARMPKGELASASRLEAGRRVTFNIEKALLQNIAVEKDPARPGGKLNYIITVANREIVSTILGFLREAGLQAVALLPIPFAWKDFVQDLVGIDASTSVAVVDIGAVRTQVCIYKGDRLHFSREFETGGRHITEAIIQAGQTFGVTTTISWAEAEEIKKSVDLLQADSMQTVKENLSASRSRVWPDRYWRRLFRRANALWNTIGSYTGKRKSVRCISAGEGRYCLVSRSSSGKSCGLRLRLSDYSIELSSTVLFLQMKRSGESSRVWPGRRRSSHCWMSASLSARRGGTPSTTQPMAGPWLSPQVV